MSSEPERSLSKLVSIILFFVAAAFWIAMMALGGGVFLSWAALTSLLSGVFLLVWPNSRFTNPLVIASSIFGIIITLVQVYLGLTLVGTILGTVALYNTVPFAVVAALYVYLLFFTKPTA